MAAAEDYARGKALNLVLDGAPYDHVSMQMRQLRNDIRRLTGENTPADAITAINTAINTADNMKLLVGKIPEHSVIAVDTNGSHGGKTVDDACSDGFLAKPGSAEGTLKRYNPSLFKRIQHEHRNSANVVFNVVKEKGDLLISLENPGVGATIYLHRASTNPVVRAMFKLAA